MIRLRVVFDVEGWAYHNRAKILQEYAPGDFEVSIASISDRFVRDDFDVLFDLNYGHAIQTRARLAQLRHPGIFVLGFNNGWPNRLDYWGRALSTAHAVVSNNRDFWERSGKKPGTYHLSNGVDRRDFRPTRPMVDRPRRVVWIGSAYHAHTTGVKGYTDFLQPLERRLRDRGVECDFRVVDPYTANGGKGSGAGLPAMTREALVEWYNGASVYVVASASEGTPNPALEAASCGCVLVTTRVGNMPELVRSGENGFLVERSVDALEDGVLDALERREGLSTAVLKDMRAWDWRERARPFYQLFRDLLGGSADLLRARGAW